MFAEQANWHDGSGVVYRAHLPVESTTPAAARRLARCLNPPDAEVGQNLELLLTEVVTNSVRHAGPSRGWVEVELQLRPPEVHVEVSDSGRGFDPGALPERLELNESGWGLYLLERLASRWGVESSDTTTVWFDLPWEPGPR